MITKSWPGDIGSVRERGLLILSIRHHSWTASVGNSGPRNKVEYVTVSANCGLWDGVSERCSHEFEGWAYRIVHVYKGGLSISSCRSPPSLKYSKHY